MENTMVLWKTLLYYTENYGTLIYYGKKTMVHVLRKNYGTIVNYSKLQLNKVNYSLLQYFLLGSFNVLDFMAFKWVIKARNCHLF